MSYSELTTCLKNEFEIPIGQFVKMILYLYIQHDYDLTY